MVSLGRALSGIWMLLALACRGAESHTDEVLSPDDQARFLAGLPSAKGPLAALVNTSAWQKHATELGAAWATSERQQIEPVRTWANKSLPATYGRTEPVFYMFGGPDFLYPHAVFQDASIYVLCGLEPIGGLPDVRQITADQLATALPPLRKSLQSELSSSYFQTEEMEVDLRNGYFTGVMPPLYIMLARSNCILEDVRYIWLDKAGLLVSNQTTTPGVRIVFRAAGHQPQTLFYFRVDLRDAMVADGGFLRWCASLGRGNSFLKATTYLMHNKEFEATRQFLLSQSNLIIQDDSGIRVRYFSPSSWTLRCFGTYRDPIKPFERNYQADLAAMYRREKPKPLPFGFGYHSRASEASVILAIRKQLN
jgi:hypothetical protein